MIYILLKTLSAANNAKVNNSWGKTIQTEKYLLQNVMVEKLEREKDMCFNIL